jgi:hypothetical protein
MVFWILLRQIDFGSFLLVVVRRIILAVFVPVATSSTMVIRTLDSTPMLIKLSGYFALTYWCWYSCRYGLTTLMTVRVHVALALRLKLKLWENLYWYLVFTGLWFAIYFELPSEKYKIVSWKKKEFEDLKNLLVFLDFIL